MRHREDFPQSVSEISDLRIPLEDGCTLSARVWMPDSAEAVPVPAILEYIPYRKRDGTVARDMLTHPYFAGHGYACLRVDIRGNGESDGLMSDEYTEQELADAVEVIAWIAAQPWCSGAVGMMGISWGGFNGLQVAALRPPALKAVVTLCSTVDRFADDIHYKGGCLLGANISWAAQMLSYSSRPPDPALVGARYKAMWLERLEAMPFLAEPWHRHQTRDAYWRHGSICEDFGALQAPVLSFGGWHDGYRNTPSHLVRHLSGGPGRTLAKAIVGPWIHKYPHFAAPEPRIGFCQEALRWWDRWLKGIENGAENDPAYRAWLMDSLHPRRWMPERPGRWIAEQVWPAPDRSPLRWHLTGAGLSDAGFSDADAATAAPPPLSIPIASPQSCGAATGVYFPFAFAEEFPDEQSGDDALSVCFDAPTTEDPLDIVGAPCVTVSVSADKPLACLAARLCDIAPDGRSALITHGFLNLTHAQSAETPRRLSPQTVIPAEIVLDEIAYRLPAGHHLRLSLSTTYWPFLWPSPEAATVTLHQGLLTVPTRPLASVDEWVPPPPEGAAAWLHETLRESRYHRGTETDAATGESLTVLTCDDGLTRDADHRLLSGSSWEETWRIHPDDPASARVTIHHIQEGGRDAGAAPWRWRTDAAVEMRGTPERFLLSGRLTVEENGQPLFERVYESVIDRDFV